jgi:hypothetical protein
MRTSALTLAIVIAVASPLTLAQSRDAAAGNAPIAVAGTSQRSVDPATGHGAKSKSAFGRAIADLTNALRDAKAREAQLTQRREIAKAPTIDAGVAAPTDAHAADRAGDRVAAQTESDMPR